MTGLEYTGIFGVVFFVCAAAGILLGDPASRAGPSLIIGGVGLCLFAIYASFAAGF